MPEFVLEESAYGGPIPEDEILQAEITGVKMVTKPFKDENGNEIRRVEFAFVVRDPESKFDTQRLWGDTPVTFTTNPDCKLRAWTQEIIGEELPTNFRLDTDTLVNQLCRVVVAQKKYTKDGQERIRNYVKDVIRSKGGSATAYAEEPPF